MTRDQVAALAALLALILIVGAAGWLLGNLVATDREQRRYVELVRAKEMLWRDRYDALADAYDQRFRLIAEARARLLEENEAITRLIRIRRAGDQLYVEAGIGQDRWETLFVVPVDPERSVLVPVDD